MESDRNDRTHRQKLVVGVWKDKLTYRESVTAARQLAGDVPKEIWPFAVGIAPSPFSYVAVREAVVGSGIRTCAQNMLWHTESGSYIGEVTPRMLLESGCEYAIAGHSERRIVFSESDEVVAAKADTAISNGIVPIVCIGESPEEKEAGITSDVLRRQVESLKSGISAPVHANQIVIAYEPVWAISTWRTDATLPEGEAIQRYHEMIRDILSEAFGQEAGEGMSILYGGSVDSENVADYLRQPDVDGALVGAASAAPDSFLATLRSARSGIEQRE